MIFSFKLVFAVLLPLAVALGYHYLCERTSFGKRSYRFKQAVCGVLFGAVAVCGTEFGVNLGVATLNVRDAGPIVAGLLFGAPAGIIAGLIGGIERWFACYWGAAEFSRTACTVATVLAGLYAAFMRKKLAKDTRPSAVIAALAAVIMEILHLSLFLFTNRADSITAFEVVRVCAVPMILGNAVATYLAAVLIKLLCGDYRGRGRHSTVSIAETLQRNLALGIGISFLLAVLFVYGLQTNVTNEQTRSTLALAIDDIDQEIHDASDDNISTICFVLASVLEGSEADATVESLQLMAEDYNVGEIDVIDKNGIITASSKPEYVGFDMSSGEQSAEFLYLLSSPPMTYYVQPYRPTAYDNRVSTKFCGVSTDYGIVQVGYSYEHFRAALLDNVYTATAYRHLGTSGFTAIIDEHNEYVGGPAYLAGRIAEQNVLDALNAKTADDEIMTVEFFGESCKVMSRMTEGYVILAVIPAEEAQRLRDVSVYVTAFLETLIFTILFYLVYLILNRTVLSNLNKVNRSLTAITEGNLDTRVEARGNVEFAGLSDGINSTVDTLKRYIAEASARIDAELEFARQIQANALPGVFPAFPDRKEIDIYATMDPAKEVGGDFYDFFFLNSRQLVLLVADVSGKGIPAAMFMMNAKSLIQSLARTGLDIAEVVRQANNRLCEGNDAGLFITAWIGVIDLTTGKVEYVNAGHNPPLLRQAGEPYAYLRSKAGLVLAGMEDYPYKKQELTLTPGSELFLYTDGVTEATDANNALYGEERLLKRLRSFRPETGDCKTVCYVVREDVDDFVDDADQFDDITMLCFRYFGPKEQ